MEIAVGTYSAVAKEKKTDDDHVYGTAQSEGRGRKGPSTERERQKRGNPTQPDALVK